MAKKTRSVDAAGRLTVSNMSQAIQALERMEAIEAQVEPLMKEAVELKKAATEYAVEKKVDVIQLGDHYYRQINRSNRFWVATPDDMPPGAPKKAKSLKEITKGIKVTVKGKKVALWNLITKRVPDPVAIDQAVTKGWIDEDEINKAYLEKPQNPFLQKFSGEAD